MISNDVKSLDILVISLNVLHNYFESSTKLFSDSIYIAKFLDTSAKPIYIILRFLSGTSLCQSPLIDRSSSACSRPVTSEVMQVYTRVPFWVNTHGNAISDINISWHEQSRYMACILYTRGRMSRKSLSETLYRSRAFIGVNTYVRYVFIIASVNRRAFPPSFVRPLRFISTSADRHGGLRMNESRFSREMDLQYRVSPLSV